MGNVERKPGFNQVCVWPATTVTNGGASPKEFEDFMEKEFGVKVQYLEEIMTRPDKCDGRAVSGTGGRIDLFFAVRDEDVMKFAIPRLKAGIRWIEDVLAPVNHNQHLYPKRVFDYKTWEA